MSRQSHDFGEHPDSRVTVPGGRGVDPAAAAVGTREWRISAVYHFPSSGSARPDGTLTARFAHGNAIRAPRNAPPGISPSAGHTTPSADHKPDRPGFSNREAGRARTPLTQSSTRHAA